MIHEKLEVESDGSITCQRLPPLNLLSIENRRTIRDVFLDSKIMIQGLLHFVLVKFSVSVLPLFSALISRPMKLLPRLGLVLAYLESSRLHSQG